MFFKEWIQKRYLLTLIFDRFGVDQLWRFVLTVKKNYRDVPYHNWTHAFAVAHSMYLVIRSGNDKFTALEVGGLRYCLLSSQRSWVLWP